MGKLVFNDGAFVPVRDVQEIVYTPFEVVKNNVDSEYVNDEGFVQSTKNDGYLGAWSYELEVQSKTYYHVHESGVTEVIIYKQPFESGEQTYYLIEINGYIYNCLPEENDVIYTTYKEARLSFMKEERDKINDSML